MKKLLHIIATPREDESRTLRVSESFLDAFRKTHADWVVENLELFKEELPELTIKRVDGKYVLLGGKELYGEYRTAWQEILAHIDRFVSADGYLLSTPMWNFNIPYRLKQYIDIIVQPKYLFRYNERGEAEGLIKNRKMVVITSRGGEYISPGAKKADLQEPYLRLIFGFVGITDISFVIAQPMDIDPKIAGERLKAAAEAAGKLGLSW